MLQVPGRDGFFAAMPAFAAGALGAKLVTFFPGNTGIHTHHALILLFSPETGEPLATMDGRLITGCARPRSRPSRPSGSPGRTPGSWRFSAPACRLAVTSRRFGWCVRSPRRGSGARDGAAFAERHGIRATGSAEEAVRGADVVVVATSSRTPVLRARGCRRART